MDTIVTLNTSGELWWGLTDVALLLCALFFGILLGIVTRKSARREKFVNSWQMVFFEFAAAALFGVLVHTFEISHSGQLWIWVILYIILFEASRLFNVRLLAFLTKREHHTARELRWLRIFQVALFAATIVLHFALPDYTTALYIFIGYAVVLLIPLLITMFKARSLFPILMMISLALSLLSQGLSEILGFGVVLGHIFDMIALYFGYRTALEDDKLQR